MEWMLLIGTCLLFVLKQTYMATVFRKKEGEWPTEKRNETTGRTLALTAVNEKRNALGIECSFTKRTRYLAKRHTLCVNKYLYTSVSMWAWNIILYCVYRTMEKRKVAYRIVQWGKWIVYLAILVTAIDVWITHRFNVSTNVLVFLLLLNGLVHCLLVSKALKWTKEVQEFFKRHPHYLSHEKNLDELVAFTSTLSILHVMDIVIAALWMVLGIYVVS